MTAEFQKYRGNYVLHESQELCLMPCFRHRRVDSEDIWTVGLNPTLIPPKDWERLRRAAERFNEILFQVCDKNRVDDSERKRIEKATVKSRG